MTKQLRLSGLWLGELALVLVGLPGSSGFAQNVRAADDYSVTLRAPNEVKQFENVELTAVARKRR